VAQGSVVTEVDDDQELETRAARAHLFDRTTEDQHAQDVARDALAYAQRMVSTTRSRPNISDDTDFGGERASDDVDIC
jgi:uncharacterized protein HemY